MNKRDEIIQCAAEIFFEKGYDGTSLQHIASELSLSKGNIYNYIKSKDELAFEVVTRGAKILIPRLEKIVSKNTNALEKFKNAVFEDVRTLIEYRCFVLIQYQKNILNANQYYKYNKYRKRIEEIFNEIIDEGVKEGYFQVENKKLTIFTILGMCLSILRWYKPDQEFTPEEIATFYAEKAVAIVIKPQNIK